MDFLDADTGWVVGDYLLIDHTYDGGDRWRPQDLSGGFRLKGVDFVDRSTGWAVGWDGVILHTGDGGLTWRPQEGAQRAYMLSVDFLDTATGWAVGWNGVILHTDDAGASWSLQESGTDDNLMVVDFVNPLVGWAVGWNGTVIRTDDGGQRWAVRARGLDGKLHGADFVDPDTGWVVGDFGLILHTRDGGRTWEYQDSGSSGRLYAAAFVDVNQGWAVGWKGTVVHTLDGGQTWQAEESGTEERLFALDFVDAASGWAVGEKGVILKYGTDRVADSSSPEQQLIDKYAPIFQLHPEEPYLPTDAAMLVDNAVLAGDATPGHPGDAGLSLDLQGVSLPQGADAYAEWYGDVMRGGRYAPTVYARVHSLEDRTVVQYWSFYLFSDRGGGYEGDWQMVELLFAEPGVATVLRYDLRPVTVAYAQGQTGTRREWASVEKVQDHPLVYVALRSHASYFYAGDHGGPPAPDRTSLGGTVVAPSSVERAITASKRVSYGQPVLLKDQWWLSFPGNWGEWPSNSGEDLRPGPAFQGPRWDAPVAWALGLPDDSGRTATGPVTASSP